MNDGELRYGTKLDTEGFDRGLDKVNKSAKKGFDTFKKGASIAVTAIGGALSGLVVGAVKARGDLEQNLGGVETIFKNTSDQVVENAKNAFKTAGMSANEYMETATSFGASLVASLGKNTELSANYVDTAIQDMSDNANKMGTDMSSIQNAYQGFAKQNFTINLMSA